MPLPRVDPNSPHSLLLRGWHTLARTPVMRQVGIQVASRVDPFLLKHSGGRLRVVGPLPTALLTTRGARSGELRENAVLYFHDGDDVILIASSFGRNRNPGWYYNLMAHPHDARLNDEPYDAVEETGAESDRLFALAVSLYPGYADYRRRTEAIGRTIPVLRLTPQR